MWLPSLAVGPLIYQLGVLVVELLEDLHDLRKGEIAPIPSVRQILELGLGGLHDRAVYAGS
jgi:hypothetical protein